MEATTMSDENYMRLAIEESRKGDWPYGAVLVKDDEIIATAFNTCRQDQDPSAHAEINVIRKAAKILPGGSFEGCTLYSSSESCPMCTGAEIWAGISRVVYGASIQQLIEIGQSQINTPSQIIIDSGFVTFPSEGGLLAEEALAAFAPCCT